MDFKDVEEKYKQLKSQFDAGQISEQDYKDRLSELMIQDEQGHWWMIGYETGRWSSHDGTNWVVDKNRSPVYPEGHGNVPPRVPPWLIAVGIILVIVIGFLTIHYVFPVPRMSTATPTFTYVTILTPTATASFSPATQTPVTPTATLPSSWNQGQIIYLQRNANNYNDMYLLDMAPGGKTISLFYQTTNQSYYSPWFSRDGSKFVFEDMNNGDTIFNLQTKGKTEFGACGSPTFSPDGSEIVCGNKNVFLFFNSNGDQERSISETNGVEPAWSPDGTLIAFAIRNGQASSLWSMDSSGHQPVQLANEPGQNESPAWSPDEKWIAYQAGQPGNTDIWIMDGDGGGKRQITHTPAGWAAGPTWSPDGRWLAFVSSQAGSVAADYGEIFVVSVETGKLHQVTRTGGSIYDWRVTWGPNE